MPVACRQQLQGVSRFVVLFAVLTAFCATGGFGQRPIQVKFTESAKMDKLASLSDGTVWAVGDGKIFVYDNDTESVSKKLEKIAEQTSS